MKSDLSVEVKLVITRKSVKTNAWKETWGWSVGAMMLGKLPVPGILLILIRVRQGRDWVAVVWTFFCRLSFFFSFTLSVWETVRYRLKYYLKGPLSPKQPTNQMKKKIKCIKILSVDRLIDQPTRLWWSLGFFAIVRYPKTFSYCNIG